MYKILDQIVQRFLVLQNNGFFYLNHFLTTIENFFFYYDRLGSGEQEYAGCHSGTLEHFPPSWKMADFS